MDFNVRVRSGQPFLFRPYGKLALTNAIFLCGVCCTVMCDVDNFHFPLLSVDGKKTQYPLNTVIAKAAKIVFYINGEDAVVKLYGVLYAAGCYDYSSTNVQYHLDRCDSYMNPFTDSSSDDDDDFDDGDDDDDDDDM